jgi:hypothetical protein
VRLALDARRAQATPAAGDARRSLQFDGEHIDLR